MGKTRCPMLLLFSNSLAGGNSSAWDIVWMHLGDVIITIVPLLILMAHETDKMKVLIKPNHIESYVDNHMHNGWVAK